MGKQNANLQKRTLIQKGEREETASRKTTLSKQIISQNPPKQGKMPPGEAFAQRLEKEFE